MEILNHKITLKTSGLIQELLNGFSNPVEFQPIKNIPNPLKVNNLGGLDFSNPKLYTIYLSLKLKDEVFEANVLHELRHIWQIEHFYPHVCNKVIVYQNNDSDFFQDLGSHIQSQILDIDVNNWLLSKGYSLNYFENMRKDFLNLQNPLDYPLLDDKYNFAQLVSPHMFTFYYMSNEDIMKHINKFSSSYEKYKNALYVANEIKEFLFELDLSNTCDCFIVMGEILTRLNLWDKYYIFFKDTKIRTLTEFESFKATL
ncbi:MAG: hypothetical protein ACK5MV_00425 [Aminipila sp.]